MPARQFGGMLNVDDVVRLPHVATTCFLGTCAFDDVVGRLQAIDEHLCDGIGQIRPESEHAHPMESQKPAERLQVTGRDRARS
jgi:hypothetical protein